MKKFRVFCVILTVIAIILSMSGCGVMDIFNINNPQKLFNEKTDSSMTIVEIPSQQHEQAPPQKPSIELATNELEPSPTPEPTVDPSIEVIENSDADFMKNRVNVLMLGLDRSEERSNWGVFRTDTMILVTVNFDTGKVDMISIPRDSYVKLHPNDKLAKINSAFSSGGGVNKNGYKYAMKTVSNLLGNIPIDYYVGFDMNVVKDVVNAMGGIEYEVDVPVKMNGRELTPGLQHLDGQGVLDYSRQRKGSSDVARVDRQQRVLMSVYDQMMSSKQIFNLPKIYLAVQENIDTNLSFAQICSLALQAANTSRENIERHIIEGEFLDMNKISFWGVSSSKLKKMVKEVFGINMAEDIDIDVKSIKAELEKASKELGALTAQAEQLLLIAEQDATQEPLANLLRQAIDQNDIQLLKDAIAKFNASTPTQDIGIPDESGIFEETVETVEILE